MAKQKSITIVVIALVTIAIALSIYTLAALSSPSTTSNLPSNGSVSASANLSVYSDGACTISP